jgi:hypothetical protein
MHDSASDIATTLAAAGLGLTTGANLFIGRLPEAGLASDGVPAPDACVAVLQTGGGAPLPFVGQGRKALLSVACQVRVRSGREDFQGGQALAFAVWEALNQTTPSPYLSVVLRESTPFYGGPDNEDRHLWALNVALTYVNVPA